MRPGQILVNTARGVVVDEAALNSALENGGIAAAVLDTWDGEPAFNPDTVQRASIATQHIAGHSWDGKIRGTSMIVRALERFSGRNTDWDETSVLGDQPKVIADPITSVAEALDLCRETVYDPMVDDAVMREFARLTVEERPAAFDAYRRKYSRRREFSSVKVSCDDAALAEHLRRLGLQVAEAFS